MKKDVGDLLLANPRACCNSVYIDAEEPVGDVAASL